MSMGNLFHYSEQKNILDCCVLSDLIYQTDRYVDKLYELATSKMMNTNNKRHIVNDSDGVQKDFFELLGRLKKRPNLYKSNIQIGQLDVDVHWGFFRFSDKLVLSYQGTHDIHEIIDDLDIKQVEFINDDIFVHEGFLKSFDTSLCIVEKYILDFVSSHPNDKIYITGHSLGGATATLATAYLMDKHKDITINCVTFGCPKIGDKNFVAYFSELVKSNIQFINEEDIVPTLPPLPDYYLLFPRYVIKDKYITKDNYRHREGNMIFDFIKKIFGFGGLSPISMHHCDNYLCDLKHAYMDLFIKLNEDE